MVARRSLALARKIGLSASHARTLGRLRTPERIQDFINALPTNFEQHGGTYRSVSETLRHGEAHCFEGAIVAACALWFAGDPPLLMDFQSGGGDDDHVVAIFRRGRHWGAISKTNHVWLRFRDPIYRDLRELAMSYFHEYVFGSEKTLRRYSVPLDLRRFSPSLWVTNVADCDEIADALDTVRHFPLVTPAQARRLKKRDAMEMRAGKLLEYRAPDRKTALRY